MASNFNSCFYQRSPTALPSVGEVDVAPKAPLVTIPENWASLGPSADRMLSHAKSDRGALSRREEEDEESDEYDSDEDESSASSASDSEGEDSGSDYSGSSSSGTGSSGEESDDSSSSSGCSDQVSKRKLDAFA